MWFVSYEPVKQHSPHNMIAHVLIFNHKCSGDIYTVEYSFLSDPDKPVASFPADVK